MKNIYLALTIFTFLSVLVVRHSERTADLDTTFGSGRQSRYWF